MHFMQLKLLSPDMYLLMSILFLEPGRSLYIGQAENFFLNDCILRLERQSVQIFASVFFNSSLIFHYSPKHVFQNLLMGE